MMKVKKKMDERIKADLERILVAQEVAEVKNASVIGQETFEPSDRNITTSTRQNDSIKPQDAKEVMPQPSGAKIEQATLNLKTKNQLLEAMERDLRERVEQNSIRYNPPKLIEKPETPQLSSAPVKTTGMKVDMSVTPVR